MRPAGSRRRTSTSSRSGPPVFDMGDLDGSPAFPRSTSGGSERVCFARPAALRGAGRNPSLTRRMTMRTDFDFAPLYRATVGFDRVFDMLDSMAGQPNH